MTQQAPLESASVVGHVIALVITKGTAGGAQTHVLNLLDGLKREAQFHVFVGEKGDMCTRVSELGVPVHIVPGLTNHLNPPMDLIAVAYLVRAFRRLRPDLVHCHSTKAGAIGRVAAALLRIPCIFTVHGWSFNQGIKQPQRGAARIAERLLSLFPTTFIAVSEATRQLGISAGISAPQKIVTIPNGLVDVAPRVPDKRAESPVMVMVGRFVAGKDQATLIKATSLIAANVAVKLRLVGDGPKRRAMESLAKEIGVAHRVEFSGHKENVDEILRASDIFILSSWHEGLPISIIEAMRAGLPVIATDVGGSRELVTDRENGFLVAAGDAPAMARAMSMLIAQPDLRHHMGAASRKAYLMRFTRELMVAQTTEVYATVLSEAESRAGSSRFPRPCGPGI